jgi:hypothetical protein
MKATLQKPMSLFILSLILTISATALATNARWQRFTYGTGAEYFGGGPGSTSLPINGTADVNAHNAYVPITDNDTVFSYSAGDIWFQNSNPTQPLQTCITYHGSTGGQCQTVTSTGNCGSGGVCYVWYGNVSLWNNNMGEGKYLVIQKSNNRRID